MTDRQLIHAFVCHGCRVRAILWSLIESNPNNREREEALVDELESLLKEALDFSPSVEELKKWEYEAHQKVWGAKV